MKKRYRDILLSSDSGERLELNDAPVGFDDMKFSLLRDMVYLGILKKISIEFSFVGDGFSFMQRHRLKYGVDANVIYRRYENNPNRFIFEGKVNQENYNEDRKLNRYNVDIIQSSFVQKFSNREDVKLNVLNTISMDRRPITQAALKEATIRGRQIKFVSEFIGIPTADTESSIYAHLVPMAIKANGNAGVANPPPINYFICDPSTFPDEAAYNAVVYEDIGNSFFVNTLPTVQPLVFNGEVNVSLTLQGSEPPVFWSTFGGFQHYFNNLIQFKIVHLDGDGAKVEEVFVQSYKNVFGNFVFPIDFSVDVPPGHSLIFLVERNTTLTRYLDSTGEFFDEGDPEFAQLFLSPVPFARAVDGGQKATVIFNSLSLIVTQDSTVPDSAHPVLLPHELFSNLIAQINGGEFYSDVFGREELGYDADGEFAYLAITTGELLRGIPLDDVQISTSFREAFSSYSSVICLGAIIEENRIRIDPLDVLFNRNIAANIGEVDDLAITPTKEFLFNSVKCGYPKNEYEEQNGRDEFNTTYQYTNSLQAVKKELDLVSKFYGDGYGIEFARRESIITTGTKDTKYDDKIFFIDLIKDGDDLVSRRQEDILFVDGIFSPDTAINLRIAAGQNMLRWRKYLNVPMDKKEKVYYFQTKDKNASLNLVTALGETVDGQDLQTGSTAYFKPEYRGFNCPITIDTLFSIMANPLGTVQYTYEGEKFFDYLFEVDAETDKGQSQWKMLGTKDSPIQTMVLPEAALSILKYGPGLDDYLKYGPGVADYLLYQ